MLVYFLYTGTASNNSTPCVLAAATSSSAHCAAETSSMVPCQGGSTDSIANDERVRVNISEITLQCIFICSAER